MADRCSSIFFALCVLVSVTKSCLDGNTYSAKVVASSLRNPVALTFSSSFGSHGFLVAEQIGVIWYLETPHVREVVLNISDRVVTTSQSMDERGLLGMTLDPHFSTNGFIFVYYSGISSRSDYDHDSVIARFTKAPSRFNAFIKLDPSSEKEILRISQPGPRQNGGQLFFGPNDGYLYITTGDGGKLDGSRFDKQSLLGKILRFNVTGGVSVPNSNPFVEDESFRPEIYAYGFRNPWRCAVDPRWIICGDVGLPGRNKEDLVVIESGGMYGWMDLPESPCTSIEDCRKLESVLPPHYHLPIHSYSDDRGQAVVGGLIYVGNRFPRLNNLYIYADYVHGTFHSLRLNADNIWMESDDLCVDLPQVDDEHFPIRSVHVNGIFEAPNGEIYILGNSGFDNSKDTGFVYTLFVASNSWTVFPGGTVVLAVLMPSILTQFYYGNIVLP